MPQLKEYNNTEFIHQHHWFPWFFIALFFTIIIGYRHEVGGDWNGYIRHFNAIGRYSINDILNRADPGYYLLNKFFYDLDLEIHEVNFICAAIFTFGLIAFAKRQPLPWLAIAVAVPYLLIVVAMGYTRQGVALGLVFWSLAVLDQQKFKTFIILVVLASTFHKTAVIMIGLGAFIHGRGKFIRFSSVVAVGIGIWSAFLSQHQQNLWDTYVTDQMQSQGAMIRVSMNLLPSLIFLLFRNEWKKKYSDYTFWLIVALGSIASVFLVSFASTAVDRLTLYFTPIQIVVYSRIPTLLNKSIDPRLTIKIIIIFYLMVLFVWLNYATHSRYWLPYKNILFDG